MIVYKTSNVRTYAWFAVGQHTLMDENFVAQSTTRWLGDLRTHLRSASRGSPSIDREQLWDMICRASWMAMDGRSQVEAFVAVEPGIDEKAKRRVRARLMARWHRACARAEEYLAILLRRRIAELECVHRRVLHPYTCRR